MDNEFLFEIDGLMNDGRYEEAIDKISELDEEEMTEELTIMLAHCLSQCAKYREALETLKSIEDEVVDDDISYHLETAGANFGMHKYRTAIREANACIEIDQSCTEAWILLCLIYQETGDDEKFEEASEIAKELDEEAWENIFGDRTDELAVYAKEESDVVYRYISENFGEIGNFMPELMISSEKKDHPVRIAIIPPDDKYPFYKLVTIGLGAYRGEEERADGKECPHRVELAAYIPVLEALKDDIAIHRWVARIMRQFAEMIQFESSWFGCGHTISYGDSLDESVGYNGVLLGPAYLSNNELKCVLPCGEEVEFLLMIPLYEEEMLFKIENGFLQLFERLDDMLGDMSEFIVPERLNTCADDSQKKLALPRSAMEDILDWDGPDGCYATDRITVDNRRIGIMYREPPESRFDSGWRFLAGDEDEEYMSNIENMDIFRLNTICNYDPDIIEYLDSPTGSAFYRNRNGDFSPMDFRSKNR